MAKTMAMTAAKKEAKLSQRTGGGNLWYSSSRNHRHLYWPEPRTPTRRGMGDLTDENT